MRRVYFKIRKFEDNSRATFSITQDLSFMKINEYIKELARTGKIEADWLLDEEEQQNVKAWFEDNLNHRKLSRKLGFGQFSVIRDEAGNLFAIYNPSKKEGYANGNFGMIKIAQNIQSGEYCLVKIQKLLQERKNPEMPEKVRREKEMVAKKQYLYGYQERKKTRKYEFKSYIFMKELPGLTGPEFFRIYQSTLTQVEALCFIKNLLEQLDQIHLEGIIHRDLHSENILIDIKDNCKVYIIDWGTSLVQDSEGYAYDHALTDRLKKYGQYRFANGFDFETIYPLFDEALNYVQDHEIKNLFEAVKQTTGSRVEGYQNIDLKPLIEMVRHSLSSLEKGERLTL